MPALGFASGQMPSSNPMKPGGTSWLPTEPSQTGTGVLPTSNPQRMSPSALAQIGGAGYKKGGKVKKTGLAKVHKGERVLTRREAKHMGKRGR